MRSLLQEEALPSLQVVDFQNERSSSFETDASTTVETLHAMVLSLPLPSSAAVLSYGGELVLCHDGRVLDDPNATMGSLGVLDAPVVVAFCRRTTAPPSRPMAMASAAIASACTHAAASATACATTGAVSGVASRASSGSATSGASASASATSASATSASATNISAASAATGAASAAASLPGLVEPDPDAVCRICFGSAFENGAGRLISPCLCSGSMRYVHVSCLNEWRAQSANPRSFVQCDQCQYQYNVQRAEWAALLESKRVVRAAAAVLLLAATALGMLLLAPLGAATHFYSLVRFHPGHAYASGRLVASMWCWQLDALVSGFLGVAAAGFVISLREAYAAHRHVSHQWLFGLVTALATNDQRIWRVFALLGFLHAMRVAVREAEKFAKVCEAARWHVSSACASACASACTI